MQNPNSKICLYVFTIATLGIIISFGLKLYLNGSRPNIILITVDALRPDNMSIYGYGRETTPYIDRLAKDGIIFNQVISVSSSTIASIPSLMTSTYPSRHLVHSMGVKMSDSIRTLAQILKKNGYYTAMIVAHLFPHFLYKRQDYNYVSIKNNCDSAIVTQDVIRWIENNRKKNFFLWIHYFDPHGPYTPPEVFARKYLNDKFYRENSKIISILDNYRGGFGGIPRYQLLGDNTDVSYYISQYDAEINYVDFQIGNLIKVLKERGLYSRTIIILTADHGESLGEHNHYFDHGGYLYDILIRVPLIIKLPNEDFKNKIVSVQISHIDVVPTILDILKIRRDRVMVGHSLKKLIFTGDSSYLPEYVFCELYEGTSKVAVRTSEWKLIFFKENNTYELYNLKNDPGELINVLDSEKTIFLKLKEILDKWMQHNISKDRKQLIPLQEIDRSYLENLGYLQ